MKNVSISDIDQLVLGYIAEQRYFHTRNNLFDESPYLPARVPILQLFGDISSENRLQTILEEYVSLKTKEQTPVCALCNECDSLSALWGIFEKVSQKIKKSHFQSKSRSCQYVEQTTTAHEDDVVGMQRFSPMQLYPDDAVSGGASVIERKKLNPLSNEYENATPEKNRQSGSAKRKSTMLPKRNRNPVHDENLASLLNASDPNDALALVGVKILSNMKKCVGKGNSAPQEIDIGPPVLVNPPQEDVHMVQATEANALPTGPGLYVEDLISNETREGLVEMTIDSLMNPSVATDIVPCSDMPNSSDDFFELRKLLDFRPTTSSNSMGFDEIVQNQQDERDLMEIIKEDNNIPDKPTPTAVPSLLVYQEDEKTTLTDYSSVENSLAGAEMPQASITNVQNAEVRLPAVSNVRSEIAEAAPVEICNQESRSSHISFFDLRNIDPDDLIDACANMPPKKRFLVKENMTPEKLQGRSFLFSQQKAAHNSSNSSPVPKLMLTSPPITAPTIVHETVADVPPVENQDTPTAPAVQISNEVAKDDTNASACPTEETSVDNVLEVESTRHILDDLGNPEHSNVRRSKRQPKSSIALKNLVPRPRSKSTKRSTKPPAKKKESGEKKSKKQNDKTKPSKSKGKVVQPQQGHVIINLKDKRRMPIEVPGIIISREEQGSISKEEIVKNLVKQMQQANKDNSTVASKNEECTTVVSNQPTPDKYIAADASDSDALMIDESAQSTVLDADYVANTVLLALKDFSKQVPVSVHFSPAQLQHCSPMVAQPQYSPQVSDINVQCEVEIGTGHDESILPSISAENMDNMHLLTVEPNGAITSMSTITHNNQREADSYSETFNEIAATSAMPVSRAQDLIMDASTLPIKDSTFLNDVDSTRDRIQAFHGGSFSSQLLDTNVPAVNRYRSNLTSSPNDAALVTPQKSLSHNTNMFSTISPSSGIFSVINNRSLSFSPKSKRKPKSARSNLMYSFLMENNTDQPLPIQYELTAVDQNRPRSADSLQLHDNGTAGTSQISDSSEMATGSRRSKSRGKRTRVKKKGGSGSIVGGQSKSMVRAEPKSHSVSVVKRCLVQSSNAEDSSSRRTRSGRSFGNQTSTNEPTENAQLATQAIEKGVGENEKDATPVPSKTDGVNGASKRKKFSKANEKRQKLHCTAGYPLINWSYEDIQARLDAIHGEKDKTAHSLDSSNGTKRRNNQCTESLHECIQNQSVKTPDRASVNSVSSDHGAHANIHNPIGSQDSINENPYAYIPIEPQLHLLKRTAHTDNQDLIKGQDSINVHFCDDSPVESQLRLPRGTAHTNTQDLAEGQNLINDKSCENSPMESQLHPPAPRSRTNNQDIVKAQDLLNNIRREHTPMDSQIPLQTERVHTNIEHGMPQVDQQTTSSKETPAIPASLASDSVDLSSDRGIELADNSSDHHTCPQVDSHLSGQDVRKQLYGDLEMSESCEDMYLESELQSPGHSVHLNKANEHCDISLSDPRKTRHKTTQILPCDLPLPEWAATERLTADERFPSNATRDDANITSERCDKDQRDENILHKTRQKSTEKQKKSRIKLKKKKFSALEKQIKKMDIAKFLDSLEYGKIS